MPDPSLVLSALEFDVLWEAMALPRRHVAVDVPSPGVTHTERADLVAHAWDTLTARGLVRRGRVDDDLAARLRVLACYRTAVDVWVWADRTISALVAHGDGYAQLAVLDAGEVWLIPASGDDLAASAVAVTGDAGAGYGRSVRVPLAALRAAEHTADGDPERMIVPLEHSGLPFSEVRALTTMLAGRRAGGQVGAQRRDADGRARRAGRVVGFFDTPRGRFLSLVGPSADGSEWVTVTPTDNARLARCVTELVDGLVDGL